MRILTGYLAASGGRASIAGHDVMSQPTVGRQRRQQLARVLVAAHGGTLFGARESVGRGQRLIARFPL